MDQEELVKKAQDKQDDKKNAKARKIARHRGWKNFWWWFFGFLSPFILIGGAGAIAVCFVPIGTFFNNNSSYVDEETQKKTMLDIIMNYQNYSVGNFPVIQNIIQKLSDKYELSKYVNINYDKLNELSFSNFSLSYLYEECLDITATVDSLGLASYLGDFANLGIMKDNTPVEGTVDPTAEGFEAYMYYYLDDGNDLHRAYTDDGTLVSEAEGKQLYYPALRNIPLDEVIKVVPTRVSQAEVVDLLGLFTDVSETSMLFKIFNGKTVNELGSFSPDAIKLSDVLTYGEGNEMLFNIICSAVVVGEGESQPTPETVTIGNLNNISIDQVHLTDIIEESDNNKQLFDVLCDACGVETSSDLTVGSISKVNINNIHITTFLEYDKNQSLYKILGYDTKEKAESDCTITALSNLVVDDIKLTSVIDPNGSEGSKQLFDVLLDSVDGATSYDDITIGKLSNIDLNKIRVTHFIEWDESEGADNTILKLLGATDKESAEKITIESLQDLDIKTVKLADILKPEDNETLYDILVDATGKDSDSILVEDLSSIELNNIKISHFLTWDEAEGASNTIWKILGAHNKDEADKLTIDSLNNLDIDNVYLNDILPAADNEKLFSILVDAVGNGATAETLKIGQLGTLDFNGIKLTNFMSYRDNQKLFNILGAHDENEGANLTVGTLSSFDVNSILLADVMDLSGDLGSILMSGVTSPRADGSTVTKDNLNIGDLGNFNMNQVPLSVIIEEKADGSNAKLISILTQASGCSSYDQVTVASLGQFEMNNVLLSTVLDPDDNSDLFNILVEAASTEGSQKTKDNLTIGDLNSFNIEQVKLSTVMGESSDNALINVLLKNGTTIGNLGTAINEVSLYDAYGEGCFTTESNQSNVSDKYSRTEDSNGRYIYTLDENGTYYISKTAGAMMLYAFDVTTDGKYEQGGRGKGKVYTPSTATLDTMTSGSGDSPIEKATIYQLIACGMLSDGDYSDYMKSLTIKDMMSIVSASTPTIPTV